MKNGFLILALTLTVEICDAQSFLTVPFNNTVVHLTNGRAYVISSATFAPVVAFNIADSAVDRMAINTEGTRMVLARNGVLQVFDLTKGLLLASLKFPGRDEYQIESMKFTSNELLEAVIGSRTTYTAGGDDRRFVQWNVYREAGVSSWTEVPENKPLKIARDYFEKKWGYSASDHEGLWSTISDDPKKSELIALLHLKYNEDKYKFVRFSYDKKGNVKGHQEVEIERPGDVNLRYLHKNDDRLFLLGSVDSVDHFYTFDLAALRLLKEKIVSNKGVTNHVSHDGSRIYSIRDDTRNLYTLGTFTSSATDEKKSIPLVQVLDSERDQIIANYSPFQLFRRNEFFLPEKQVAVDTDHKKIVDELRQEAVNGKKVRIVSWETSPNGNYLLLLYNNPPYRTSNIKIMDINARNIIFQADINGKASKILKHSVIVEGQEYDLETGWLLGPSDN